MATTEKNLLEKIERLYYKEKLSAQDVANRLDLGIDAIYYCMRKNGLKRREKHESNSIKFDRTKPSFTLRKIKSQRLKMLKAIGTMLYWGEGCKSDKMITVDFANSDKDMIVVFLKFLREVCGVDEKRLRVYPYFYANQNINNNIDFWSKITRINKSQFTKPYVKKDFDETKKDKMPYGLIHIRYADKKLLNLIKSWIEDYKNF